MFVRCAVANMAFDNNERRCILGSAENLDCFSEPLQIVDISHAQYVPAIGKKTRRHVVTEGEIRMPFDCHAVAVVKPAKIPKHLMTGERSGFIRHALHHVAVAAYHVDVIVEYGEVRPIKALCRPASCERHANAIAATLP